MRRTQIIRHSLLAVGITAAIALFIWRTSIDWTHITPRGIRDAAQEALSIALLVSLAFLSSPPRQRANEAHASSNPIRILSFILATALGGIILFDGYLANQRLACRDRALSEAAAASAQQHTNATRGLH